MTFSSGCLLFCPRRKSFRLIPRHACLIFCPSLYQLGVALHVQCECQGKDPVGGECLRLQGRDWCRLVGSNNDAQTLVLDWCQFPSPSTNSYLPPPPLSSIYQPSFNILLLRCSIWYPFHYRNVLAFDFAWTAALRVTTSYYERM